MTIQTQLLQSDFIKLTFILLFKRFSFFFIILANVILFISALVGYFFYNQESAVFLAFTSLIFSFLLLFSVYISAKKQYASNPRIGMLTNYQFSATGITITRDNQQSTLKWNEVISVKRRNNLLMIWQTKFIAHIITTQSISSEELNTLRTLLHEKNIPCKF